MSNPKIILWVIVLVNELSNGALESYGLSMGLNSWVIQELSWNLGF
jgi:hypothetical protein